MHLLDRLNVRDAASAASVTLHEYVSDRSVALLLKTAPDALSIGSGTCVVIRQRYFVITAGHNLEGVTPDQIGVVPRGSNYEEALPVIGAWRSLCADVGWVELDGRAVSSSRLKSIELCHLASLRDSGVEPVPVHVQGYPAARVTSFSDATSRPRLQSVGLLTLVILPRERSTPENDVNFAVEYPPWDQSIDHLPVPDPPGVSGGGVWQVPHFHDGTLWSPEQARLLGLIESWNRRTKELFCVRIESWLQGLRDAQPELANEIYSINDKSSFCA